MQIKIRDKYADDELAFPRQSLVRWYKYDNTVTLFFTDGSLVYHFADKAKAGEFQLALSIALVESQAKNYTVQTETVSPPEEEEPESEEEEDDPDQTV